jgi:tripartite-type tricarboxylate transporter receptor subunit TctC
MALVVNTASSKAKTLKELVEYGKANPGALKYASFGSQSVANLAAQRFATLSGIGWREVPYKGAPQIVQDIINGNVDAYFGLTTVSGAVANQPNVTVMAFSDKKRTEQLKDVPTFAEVGYPDLADFTVAGVWAPANTPKPVVDKLKKALEDAKKVAKLKEQAEKTGNFIYEGTPEQFDADVRKAAVQYANDFKKLGIEPE